MLSLTSKYTINALRYLAKAPKGNYINVQEISKAVKIPSAYLSKLIKILVKKKILESKRGALGGVRFSLNGRKLTYYDICKKLDDPIVNELCFLTKKGCNLKETCTVHEKWSSLRIKIHEFLKSTTFNF